ncbi:MATE family efflux transporter [Scleromatobacter humisilvae]|uniref:Multidrug-efflux transporter n=1 Tax=Scleromatobacter humisilvae TaxID=2897159 RepID=A0A9X2C085_9BURK|nr:MATE family efflux transporter [Scleromatobacter humisilvae]MCK9687062.1 MATE family efflux transporter [Scleromatobacter humisilvae]
MRDLTQGSIRGHLIAMAMPITIGMLVQTLYLMVDLYFVSSIGKEAVAGVAAAGNVTMLVMALTQMLAVATVSLVARALGAKDKAAASRVFGQAMLLGMACVVATIALGVGLGPSYMRGLAADAGVASAGVTFILWSLPGLALQFVLAVAGSVLRGAGIARPGMVVQLATVGMNIVLAPILIAGWGTHHPLGVAGAGLATSLSVAVGVLLLARYLRQLGDIVAMSGGLPRPAFALLGQMLRIGLPAGGEFVIMVVLNSINYALIRDFGADAQAGFGIAARVMQALVMPAMAVSFAIPAIAGQNFGGRRPDRVMDTLKQGLAIELVLMASIVAVCQLWAPVPVAWFTADPRAAEVAVTILHVVSWNFFGAGIVFACSGMFQAMGNTLPALLSSFTRLLTFVLPALWISRRAGFALIDVWHLSVASVFLQAIVSLVLVRRQMGTRLAPMRLPASEAATVG